MGFRSNVVVVCEAEREMPLSTGCGVYCPKGQKTSLQIDNQVVEFAATQGKQSLTITLNKTPESEFLFKLFVAYNDALFSKRIKEIHFCILNDGW